MSISDDLTHYGIVHSIPIMMADGMDFLLKLLEKENPETFLEIGTAIAKTSILAAMHIPKLQVVTIEKDPEMIEQARRNIEASGLKERITLIEGDAREVQIPLGPYDFIFIDAAKGQYQRFFERYAPMLSENGVIVSDNMKFHGLVEHPERTQNRHTKSLIRHIQKYRKFLEDHPDFTTEFTDEGDGLAITRRKRHA